MVRKKKYKMTIFTAVLMVGHYNYSVCLASVLTSSANHGTRSAHSFVFFRQSLVSHLPTQVPKGCPRPMWEQESVCTGKCPDATVSGGAGSGRLAIRSW